MGREEREKRRERRRKETHKTYRLKYAIAFAISTSEAKCGKSNFNCSINQSKPFLKNIIIINFSINVSMYKMRFK